jgi:hypothetical protein
MVGAARGSVFLRYVNSVGSEIDGLDLICVSCASRCHVHPICSQMFSACALSSIMMTSHRALDSVPLFFFSTHAPIEIFIVNCFVAC